MKILFFIFPFLFLTSSLAATLEIVKTDEDGTTLGYIFRNKVTSARIGPLNEVGKYRVSVCSWGETPASRACCTITSESKAENLQLFAILARASSDNVKLTCGTKSIENISALSANFYWIDFDIAGDFGVRNEVIDYKE
ncbi:MAG: hypothetical protein AAF203_10755 [Pseudomonadota bacterium]